MRDLLAGWMLTLALGSAGCGDNTPGSMDLARGDMAAAAGGDMAGGGGDLSGPVTWTVHVSPNNSLSFMPSVLTIKAGDTVHWVWDSDGHNVVSGNPAMGMADGTFCSPNDMNCAAAPTSKTGATYDHTFTM